jgi:ribonucleoside-diphosphate reductase alpha subunit
MFVIKRSGEQEQVSFDKITARIKKECVGLDPTFVDPVIVAQKVCQGVYSGVTTIELDNLAAETAAYLTSKHFEYAKLAARIAMSNLHKNTLESFVETERLLFNFQHPKMKKANPLLSKKFMAFIEANAVELENAIVSKRDDLYSYFAFKTLEKSYLTKLNGKIVERPQHMWMRVACAIHDDDVKAAIATYNSLSLMEFTHASPTLFNAGHPKGQYSSCFLLTIKKDSIAGIYDTLKRCALISKSAGGIGLAVHKIRATGSYIAGTNGNSNGLMPALKVYNDTARYVDQGGGKRKGAFAVYLEPWHADIEMWLESRNNSGGDELRTRDLFMGLWIPDLFMERAKANQHWTYMCPNECPGLDNVYGNEFKVLYESYEKKGMGRKTIKARDLLNKIAFLMASFGSPYVLFKDTCNRKSNQKNLGTIPCSNLCTEIVQWSGPDEVAVCNLASVSLPSCVVDNKFDFQCLFNIVQHMVRNLNKVIDKTHYPLRQAKRSNLKHRPMGIGVQGFQNALFQLRLTFCSKETNQLNRDIFETIYYAALDQSAELAKALGPYESYEGSPMSQGILQFDMWNVQVDDSKWNWTALRQKIKTYGIRNSLLVAPMPTASTSQIFGNIESFEPQTSNLYVRRTLAGEFVEISSYLLKDLIAIGMWTPEIINMLVAENGSVQNIPGIPDTLKNLYKTAFEIPHKVIVELAIGRGPFICQSQSMNMRIVKNSVSEATAPKIIGALYDAWEGGLKTASYYTHTRAIVDPIKFTVDQSLLQKVKAQKIKLAGESLSTSSPVAPLGQLSMPDTDTSGSNTSDQVTIKKIKIQPENQAKNEPKNDAENKAENKAESKAENEPLPPKFIASNPEELLDWQKKQKQAKRAKACQEQNGLACDTCSS